MEIKPFPKPPPFVKLVGPSLILIGLGLGSGEVILWPFLSANYGLGIIWAAVLGITFQFFMNMEIERYALVKGESVFAGFSRMSGLLPVWFILSSFIGFMWPGMSAASAAMLGNVFGISVGTHYIAVVLLVLTGIIFTLGPVLYKIVELFQKTIIFISVPLIVFLVVWLAKSADWASFANGFIGQGDGYSFIPAGISWAVFLSAFAYAGAGGNLNLTQSNYIKDKGYGMGVYSDRISSPITRKKSASAAVFSDSTFAGDKNDIKNFRNWWRKANGEHAVAFWFTGALTMTMLILLSFVTVHGESGISQGINFVLAEASVIGERTVPIFGSLFLIIGSLMLLSTQIGVFESCSRIIAENVAILKEKSGSSVSLSKIFYIVLWVFIILGSIILLAGFNEPKTLIVLGAVINAVAMLVHLVLVYFLNRRELKKEFQPVWWRKAIIFVEILFFAVFSAIVFWDKFFG